MFLTGVIDLYLTIYCKINKYYYSSGDHRIDGPPGRFPTDPALAVADVTNRQYHGDRRISYLLLYSFNAYISVVFYFCTIVIAFLKLNILLNRAYI